MDAFELVAAIGTVLFDEPFKTRLPKLMAPVPDDAMNVNLTIPVSVISTRDVQLAVLAMRQRAPRDGNASRRSRTVDARATGLAFLRP